MKPYMGLKVGDKVFVHSIGCRFLATVEKVTPKFYVKVNGNLYDHNGILRGGGAWHKSHIEPADEEMIAEYNRERFVRETLKKMREVNQITYEQAVAIDAILNG